MNFRPPEDPSSLWILLPMLAVCVLLSPLENEGQSSDSCSTFRNSNHTANNAYVLGSRQTADADTEQEHRISSGERSSDDGPQQDDQDICSLNGGWRLSVQCRKLDPNDLWNRDKPWTKPRSIGDVDVPGFYYPDFGALNDQQVLLFYERELSVPASWKPKTEAGSHVLAEFDSVDYFAHVAVKPSDGPLKTLGSHEGRCGRFAVPLGSGLEGTLRVSVMDFFHHPQSYKYGIVKAPLLKTGVDRYSGILEPVRLRLTGPVYLRNAFAATLEAGEPAKVRLGAEIIPLEAGKVDLELRYEVLSPQVNAPIAEGSLPVVISRVEVGKPVEIFREVSISGVPVSDLNEDSFVQRDVRISVVMDNDLVSDSRVVPFINRRVVNSGKDILVNGNRTFLKGSVIFHLIDKLLLHDDSTGERRSLANVKDGQERYFPSNSDRINSRLDPHELPRELKEENLDIIRHEWPTVRKVYKAWRRVNFLIYESFSIVWNVDYKVLTPENILKQFDEFLWRTAAEPAVCVIALHQEAEFLDDSPSGTDKKTTHKLLTQMLFRAREVAPHLIVAGNSGGEGSAVFPPERRSYPLNADVVDVHTYPTHQLGYWIGYRQIPKHLAEKSSPSFERNKPVIISEGAGGWKEHVEYLLGLSTSLSSSEHTRFSTLPELSVRKLFYSGYICGGVYKKPNCDEPLLIELVKDFYFADRQHIFRPDGKHSRLSSKEMQLWIQRLLGDSHACLMYEARINYYKKTAMSSFISWDVSDGYGFPILPEFLGGTAAERDALLKESRNLVLAAYAPLTMYSRPVSRGEDLEIFILNDEQSRKATLVLETAGEEVVRENISVSPRGLTSYVLKGDSSVLTRYGGRVATARLVDNQTVLAEYCMFLPSSDSKKVSRR